MMLRRDTILEGITEEDCGIPFGTNYDGSVPILDYNKNDAISNSLFDESDLVRILRPFSTQSLAQSLKDAPTADIKSLSEDIQSLKDTHSADMQALISLIRSIKE